MNEKVKARVVFKRSEIEYLDKTKYSEEDMKLQFETLNHAYTLLEDVSFTDKQVTNLKGKLDDAVKALEDGEFKNELIALSEHLEKMHKESSLDVTVSYGTEGLDLNI